MHNCIINSSSKNSSSEGESEGFFFWFSIFFWVVFTAVAVAMVEFRRLGKPRSAIFTVMVCLLYRNLNLCWSLNDEGLALLKLRERVVTDPFGALSNWHVDDGVVNPCSWFGVECSDGNVVVLNLKGLCVEGTLAPDLGNLIHIKSIILRNNSFYGIIPEVIGDLKELEVLDLGYNNFSGPLPSELGPSLAILLLDNNELLGSTSPEIHELQMISEVQMDKNKLSNSAQRSSRSEKSLSWNVAGTGDAAHRRLLEDPIADLPKPEPFSTGDAQTPSPSSSPSPSLTSDSPSSSPSPSPAPFTVLNSDLTTPPTSHASPPSLSVPKPSRAESPNRNHHRALILSAAIGGPVLLLVLFIIILCHSNKVAVVRPWATGLSGQLQKAFVTGVPKLKRSELEAACEDFSNVIGSSSIGTVFKGTLSNGVEIAVASVAVTSAKDWSNNLEAQFRNKIDSLSKVNHKNFMNLLGYCEEDEPFTRMLVFEYAPNGTLYEHLHVKEAEHLDWGTRMRIIMGISYCLEHMHQLTPRVAHKNLNSSAVSLTEDYAAKVSDFGFWSSAAETESSPESNVYSFGILLFEVVTGRALPYSADNGCSFEDCWASQQSLREMVDPTLTHFRAEQVEQIGEVIKSCVRSNARRRPQMGEVTARLREITAIGPDGAVPELSPLWWAELEIMSTEAS